MNNWKERDKDRAPNPEDVLPFESEAAPRDPSAPDNRTPIERLRAIKRAFSVSDLVAPSWCEIQYWYTLTRKQGKKTTTPAMAQGSVVHKTLEEEVFKTIKVDLHLKQDKWGLKIWNVIQGLRLLRETGQTRELEIWGVIDGYVVNGIIDELSYKCPDPTLEAYTRRKSPGREAELPPQQSTIYEYFNSAGAGGSILRGMMPPETPKQRQKVYLSDVKTRNIGRLPSAVAFRGTRMQLMLYHRLLSELATNNVDLAIIAKRYELDTDKVFSDSFLAQVGGLNDGQFHDAQTDLSSNQSSTEPNWSQDSLTTLTEHNTISSLWSLMISEFQLTFPDGINSLSTILNVEYRSRETAQIIGKQSFLFDGRELGDYVDHEFQWWKGERKPQGVVVEEAFKCKSCEFAEGCEWRIKKADEAKQKSRASRGTSKPGLKVPV